MSGIEWIVEAHGCSPQALQNVAIFQELFHALIQDVGLQPIGETVWHKFPDPGGVTGMCLLSESHLTCHTFPEFGSLCLNLFCCRARPEWDFQSQLRQRVGAQTFTVRRLERPYAGNLLEVAAARSTA